MKQNKFIIGGLVLILILTSACLSESNLTTQEIQTRLIEAKSNLDSYAVDTNVRMAVATELMEQPMRIDYLLISKSDVDRVNKKMIMTGTINMDMIGMKSEMETEGYVVDGYLYTKALNQWMKMELDDDMWVEQDQVRQLIELTESGSVERLPDESFDDNSYYVLALYPDLEKLAELSLKQQQDSELPDLGSDFEESIKEYSSTIWVNKKTFVIDRSVQHIVMAIASDGSVPFVGGGISTDATHEIRISDVGKEVVFDLPADARDAVDLSDLMGLSEFE